MKIPIHQIDAFTSERFRGNPAAVCPTPAMIAADLMQSIAAENNLSETAFIHGGDGRYHIRWFTPQREVRLCGHATLAAGFVVMTVLEPDRKEVEFTSASGRLAVTRLGNDMRSDAWWTLDFPIVRVPGSEPSPELERALGVAPVAIFENDEHHVAVLDSEHTVRELTPDVAAIQALGKTSGCVVTAESTASDVDYVCRYFAPGVGIAEDPVTGSAQCRLAPIWAERLGKTEFVSHQVSARGGVLRVRLVDDRTWISGQCVDYLRGEITV